MGNFSDHKTFQATLDTLKLLHTLHFKSDLSEQISQLVAWHFKIEVGFQPVI